MCINLYKNYIFLCYTEILSNIVQLKDDLKLFHMCMKVLNFSHFGKNSEFWKLIMWAVLKFVFDIKLDILTYISTTMIEL